MTRGIEDWIRENFPKVKLISFDKDIGTAASRNAGLSTCNPNSKYVVFVDNDTKMHAQWLRSLVTALETTPEVGAAQPILVKMNESEKIDSLGGFFDYIGYACLSPFFSGSINRTPKKQIDICYCEAVTAIKRSVLDQLQDSNKPYDPEYFQHWEDIDMCWKVMLLGYRIVLVPNSIVSHERGVSAGLGKQSADLVYMNTRNRLTTLLKNYELWNLIKYVPALVFSNCSKLWCFSERVAAMRLQLSKG
jgi:GT2 family glycosyltransferase